MNFIILLKPFSAASSVFFTSGTILSLAGAGAALLVMLAVLLLVVHRRRQDQHDRNMHLAPFLREGATAAYIPEVSFPDNPFKHREAPEFRGDSRLWQTRVFAPALAMPAKPQPTPVERSPAPRPVRSTWAAISLVDDDDAARTHFFAPLWSSTGSKTEAQQRRKEQREASWEHKKRTRQASMHRDDDHVVMTSPQEALETVSTPNYGLDYLQMDEGMMPWTDGGQSGYVSLAAERSHLGNNSFDGTDFVIEPRMSEFEEPDVMLEHDPADALDNLSLDLALFDPNFFDEGNAAPFLVCTCAPGHHSAVLGSICQCGNGFSTITLNIATTTAAAAAAG